MSASRRPFAAGVTTLLVLAALGCAKREPPSGGPPDIIPPRILSSAPDSGAARVPPDVLLSITFTEAMEPRSTEESVALAPRTEILKRRWKGRTLSLVLAERLRPDHTYTLFVGGTARDRHGNPMGRGATIVFSTRDSFPHGRIAGEIEARGLEAQGVAMWCYEAAGGRVPDSTARDFDALGLAGEQGRFRVDGLDVPGRYRLWAFADLNNNHSFEPLTDVLAAVDTLIELTPGRPVIDSLRVRLVNPHAPGSVRGAVLDSLVDSLGVMRVVAESEKDTTRHVAAVADTDGTFELELDAGAWRLRAFRDLDRNETWQPDEERASDRLLLRIEPAGDIVDLKLRLRRGPGGP